MEESTVKKKTLIAIISLCIASSCIIREPDESPQMLFKTSFKAIKKNDWSSFSKYVLTMADILQKQMGVKMSKFKQKQSYAGGVLKPEQMKSMKVLFEKAQRNGPRMIIFKESKFAGIGTLLDGHPDDKKRGALYSIRIKINGEEIDSKDMYPLFLIMPWEGSWRILDLIFPKESNEEKNI
jgi:hypothetical protein